MIGLWLCFLSICCIACPTQIPPRCFLDYSQIPYTTLNDFQHDYASIKGCIGTGTSGSVFKAVRHADNATIATKRIPVCLLKPGQQTVDQQVRLEFHIGSLLANLEGIAYHFDLLWENGTSTWFMITSFCPRSLAKERRSIGLEGLTDIFLDVVSTIMYMHDQGIAHGDIKIENILLTAEGRPKVIDFGAATFIDCPTETPGLSDLVNVVPGDYGTTPYMPPEIYFELEYDKEKADVWSLGVLWFVMVTGSVPWSSASVDDEQYEVYAASRSTNPPSSLSYCSVHDQLFMIPAVCSQGFFDLIQKVPSQSRDMMAQMLTPNPLDRPSLREILASNDLYR